MTLLSQDGSSWHCKFRSATRGTHGRGIAHRVAGKRGTKRGTTVIGRGRTHPEAVRTRRRSPRRFPHNIALMCPIICPPRIARRSGGRRGDGPQNRRASSRGRIKITPKRRGPRFVTNDVVALRRVTPWKVRGMRSTGANLMTPIRGVNVVPLKWSVVDIRPRIVVIRTMTFLDFLHLETEPLSHSPLGGSTGKSLLVVRSRRQIARQGVLVARQLALPI